MPCSRTSLGNQDREYEKEAKKYKEWTENEPNPFQPISRQQPNSPPVAGLHAMREKTAQKGTQCPDRNEDREWHGSMEQVQTGWAQNHRQPRSPCESTRDRIEPSDGLPYLCPIRLTRTDDGCSLAAGLRPRHFGNICFHWLYSHAIATTKRYALPAAPQAFRGIFTIFVSPSQFNHCAKGYASMRASSDGPRRRCKNHACAAAPWFSILFLLPFFLLLLHGLVSCAESIVS